MTSSQSYRVDRDDLAGERPQAGPKVPTATPDERQRISEWLRGGMNAAIKADSFGEYMQKRWAPNTASRG